jgi:hypothetical protein
MLVRPPLPFCFESEPGRLLRADLCCPTLSPSRTRIVDAGGGSSSTSKASEGEVVGDKEMRARSKASTRFAEQGWSLLYYTVYWSFGMVRLFFFTPRPTSYQRRRM